MASLPTINTLLVEADICGYLRGLTPEAFWAFIRVLFRFVPLLFIFINFYAAFGADEETKSTAGAGIFAFNLSKLNSPFV